RDSWLSWREQFLNCASATLSFAVMDASKDPVFLSCGRPFIHVQPYVDQLKEWPISGKHILAQYDHTSIIVYQAYRTSIGHFDADCQYFEGEFSLQRMSWIMPNFLWMMYRSGWGTKAGQEVTLAIRLKRAAFDEILKQAVHSSFKPSEYASEKDWKKAVAD